MNEERVQAWLTECAESIEIWAHAHHVDPVNVNSILAICAIYFVGAVEDMVEARVGQAVSSLTQASGGDFHDATEIRSWLNLIRFPSIANEY